jgi:glycosyltransferase involved in cell wall biosynthesis
MRAAAFAIPGDIETKTGGYIYERMLLEALRSQGRDVQHLVLPAGFPDPTGHEMEEAVAKMAAVSPDRSLIIDGLVFGAVETAGLATVRAPIVAMIHHPLALETGLRPRRAALLRRREADNLALAAQVVVPSPHTAQILKVEYGVDARKVHVALPGFAAPDPVRLPSWPPLILSVGILAPRKGHDILLRALALIADLEWRAVIVGAPHFPQTALDLRALLSDLRLDARVCLAGLVEEAVLRDFYRRASVFALATRYEGYGIVLGEALLHGLPIVSCRVGAVPQTVPEGAGLLVPPDDVSGFANALRVMLSDAEKRARCASVSEQAGHALTAWSATARVMGDALDRAWIGRG